jgi:pimeloyl-ACP methyl ester carboxylesterase
MRTFVLIHGAWHGGWCWGRVAPLLEAEGHTVIAPDFQDATLEASVDRVLGILDTLPGPAIVIGHSMGGAVASQAAEYRPEKTALLVYLCAYLLGDGESLAGAARRDNGSESRESIVVSPDRAQMTLAGERVNEIFYAGCSEADAAWARARLLPQATAPWRARLSLSPERFGRVPRVYIECLRDRAISPAFQREMYTAMPCRAVFTLDAGHMPHICAPRQVADLLLEL